MISQRFARPLALPLQAFWLWFSALAMVAMLGGMSAARAAPESFADLAQKVSPAVVDITTTTLIAAPATSGPTVPPGSPFEDFFNNFMNPGPNAPKRPRRTQALGSGFVISEDGYIVTNDHVIDKADEVMIEFYSGKVLRAKVVGTDLKTDIALLKVNSDTPLPFVRFGDSDAARVGDWVMAMGNPLGQGFSISAGIISARNRKLSGAYDDFLQTDAAINRGNSGGPLFNMDGEVIGVNTAILSPNGGSIGIGFSMSSAVVSRVVEQLRQFGETRRGWLGVRIQDVTQDVADSMGLAAPTGALVTDVPDGPAKDAGVKPRDVIVSFDGHDVANTRDLVRRVGNAAAGRAVRVVVLRDGKSETLKITLGRRETAETASAAAKTPAKPAPAPVQKILFGLTLTPLGAALRQSWGLDNAIQGLAVMDVAPASRAYDKGLRAKDVIVEVGQQKVVTISQFETRLEEVRKAGRKSVLLLVRRANEPRFVTLPVE